MGKPQSKLESHSGDPQVRIINMQAMHSEQLDNQEIKIYIILTVVIVHLGITMYQIRQRNNRKQAIKTAKSIFNLKEANNQ